MKVPKPNYRRSTKFVARLPMTEAGQKAYEKLKSKLAVPLTKAFRSKVAHYGQEGYQEFGNISGNDGHCRKVDAQFFDVYLRGRQL